MKIRPLESARDTRTHAPTHTHRHDKANSPLSQFCQRAHNKILAQYTCFVNLNFWFTLKSAAAVWVAGQQLSEAVATPNRDLRARAWVKGRDTPKILAKVTPRSRTLLEDLTGPQPVKKLSPFYGSRRLNPKQLHLCPKSSVQTSTETGKHKFEHGAKRCGAYHITTVQ